MPENKTQQFAQKLAQEAGVSVSVIQEIVRLAFRDSYCQGENQDANLHFEFNSELLVRRLYQIVKKVINPAKEITLDSELIKENKEGKIKDKVFFLPIETKKLSFSLSQEIKKRLKKDLGKIRQAKEYETYANLQGQLISGKLQSMEKDYYLINLGKDCYGYWKKTEQPLLTEKLHLGQKLTFLLKEIKSKNGSNQIILTRHDDLFWQKVLALEIPEIKNQIIVIRDILRLPNLLNKVIIENRNPHINALGACIGKDYVRARSISQIIYPERIIFVVWQENKRELFLNLVDPVKIISILEKGNDWEVITPSYQGEEIITTIGDYLGKNIHLFTLEEKEAAGNYITVWNGNLAWEEYQKFQ